MLAAEGGRVPPEGAAFRGRRHAFRGRHSIFLINVSPVNLTATDLNEYFCSIGKATRDAVTSEFERSGRVPLNTRLPRVHTGALNIIPVTLQQLHSVVVNLPNRDSCVPGDVPVKIIKLCFQYIGPLLLRIINTSIVTESVPSSWKCAIVLPLHKKGDPSQPPNFRPITNVPTICKIIEKLVHHQITAYLDHYCLFSEDQHGFLARHSTTTALVTMTDQILAGMDRSEVTLLALIDLSRCFDVVDHAALLTSLQQLQISTGWIESYLAGHTQRVRVGDTLSDTHAIDIGTFQGSCLGPLLYMADTYFGYYKTLFRHPHRPDAYQTHHSISRAAQAR